ncbi:hypothetical protein RIF29_09133 [Crotalaria pallida]|uniref:DJ-1/PfpI domain-containing protein n=1 Tax=Crotalaria pallida TaxID=3830 RepID=A0AAN9FRI7_CROPI
MPLKDRTLTLLKTTYTETRCHNFALNATFDEVDATSYDGLVLPGGRAPEYLAHNPAAVELVTKFASSGKAIASICHGQLILAAAGLAKGRKCTAFPPVRPTLVASGAHWVEPDTMSATVVDGNLITAATYEGHPEFIRHFVKALGGNISGSNKKILFLCGANRKSHQEDSTLVFEGKESMHADISEDPSSFKVLSVWFLFDIITVLRSECDKAAVAKVLMYVLKHMRDRQGAEKITILSRF